MNKCFLIRAFNVILVRRPVTFTGPEENMNKIAEYGRYTSDQTTI